MQTDTLRVEQARADCSLFRDDHCDARIVRLRVFLWAAVLAWLLLNLEDLTYGRQHGVDVTPPDSPEVMITQPAMDPVVISG